LPALLTIIGQQWKKPVPETRSDPISPKWRMARRQLPFEGDHQPWYFPICTMFSRFVYFFDFPRPELCSAAGRPTEAPSRSLGRAIRKVNSGHESFVQSPPLFAGEAEGAPGWSL